MNIEQALVTTWNASSGVQAVLGNPPRIYPGVAPQGVARPYAVYNIISEEPIYHLGGESAATRRMIQFDIYGLTALSCRTVEVALRTLLSGQVFTVTDGPTVRSLKTSEIAGADFGDGVGEGFHRLSVDYSLFHTL